MSTILINPSASPYLGQGMTIECFIDPVPAGMAHVRFEVFETASGTFLTSANVDTPVGSVSAGLGYGGGAFISRGAAPGAAVTVRVTTFDAGWAELDHTDFVATYLHDPVSGLWGLIANLPAAGLVHDPMLDTILANSGGSSFKFPLIGVLQSTFAMSLDGGVTADLGSGPIGSLFTWGLSWEVTSAPTYTGGQAGVIQDAMRRVIQIAVDHTISGGAGFTDQTFESHGVTGTCWFDSPDPSNVSVYIYPGYTANLNWLTT